MPDFDSLLAAEADVLAAARAAKGAAKRVLVATSMGGFNHGAMTEKALAVALSLRGAQVEFFLCDGGPGCQLTKIEREPPESVIESDIRIRCRSCVGDGKKAFKPTGLKILKLSQFVTDDHRREAAAIAASCDIGRIKSLTLDGWAIGEHAYAGALRFYARGDISGEPLGDPVARQFVKASVLTARGIDAVLKRGYDVAVFNHGIYTPQGVIGEVARSRGVRVVNWNPAYRSQCFIFSHGDSYHHTMIDEGAATWEGLPLTPERRARVEAYLRDRRQAKADWIWFNRSADLSADEIRRRLALDDRPIALALTSVVWDACLHYESNAFESLKDWMLQTIAYFRERTDLQLVVRIHPAEVSGFVKSRDKMGDVIAAAFPELPENVKVVAPEDDLSTYSLIDMANAVLVYSTKTGIEASAAGAPVVVAGEAWIRNKGFTRDAIDPHSYRAILDELPFADRLSPPLKERALRYAYHFFFRRMIDLPFMTPSGPNLEISVAALKDLAPGRHSGLDAICDGVLNETPFVHDAVGD